jgi:hypothetical protein
MRADPNLANRCRRSIVALIGQILWRGRKLNVPAAVPSPRERAVAWFGMKKNLSGWQLSLCRARSAMTGFQQRQDV